MYPRIYTLTILLAALWLGGCASAPTATLPAPATAVPTDVPAGPTDVSPSPTPDPIAATMPFPAATLVLAWHREGGIAGYCDDLKVYADGSFTVLNCVSIPGSLRSGQLDQGQLAQLTAWVNTFQSFAISDGQRVIAPDGMLQKTAFTGAGLQQAGPSDREAIDSFASLLVIDPLPVDGGDNPPAVLNAREYLARELNVPAGEISIVSFGFMQWPDRCLGVVVLGEMCAQGITPGYQVILRAQAQLYELHTDENGDSIRQVR